MIRAELVRALVRSIAVRDARRIAIDGRSAAGKSSLAAELDAALRAAGLQVRQLSIDAFHHPRAYRYRQGELSPRGYYEDAFDCVAAGEAARAAPAEVVLIFEGVFALRRELAPMWDYRILVDIDGATSIARGWERDRGVIGTPEEVLRKYQLRYEPAWQLYAAERRPETLADAIIDHRDLFHPRVVIELHPVKHDSETQIRRVSPVLQ